MKEAVLVLIGVGVDLEVLMALAVWLALRTHRSPATG
jgi:hypothetical protein